MNRPYGAVDVAANLKGAVAKTATQKILVALAEKGELVQKTYGKMTFFVANQAKIETLPPERINALEAEYKAEDEENKAIAAQTKTLSNELAKIRGTPTNDELGSQIGELKTTISKRNEILAPLRSGAPLVSAEDIAKIDADWEKWRMEWTKRKKVFKTLWDLATDSLPPQDADILAEDLGIEFDTSEHVALEKGPLFVVNKNPLKRKR
ncbi:PSMC3 interacting protein [Stygiomarasmius scandens]|uniref:PSMC3 interacting protein n=1 Tax=Marasmiellus scandens TaxID=2682957 RepID=A0ABR1KBG6_9AGAR